MGGGWGGVGGLRTEMTSRGENELIPIITGYT